MQLLFSRSRRFRPKVTASAIALTIAGMSSSGVAAEANEAPLPSFHDQAQSAGAGKNPQPSFFAQRHRPWRHHIYCRASSLSSD